MEKPQHRLLFGYDPLFSKFFCDMYLNKPPLSLFISQFPVKIVQLDAMINMTENPEFETNCLETSGTLINPTLPKRVLLMPRGH